MKNITLTIFKILSRYGWTATLLLLALFAVGFTWSSSDELYVNIRLFDKAALVISNNYVEKVDGEELIQAGIEGMVSRLDRFSKFLSGPDYLNLLQETDGEFEGIGVSLEFHHDTLTVESVLEGTPAYYGGIKPGDRVTAIDGKDTDKMDMTAIRTLLRGPKYSVIKLRIHRPDAGDLDFAITRDVVEIEPVAYLGMVDSRIGYIRLARFSEESSKDVRRAVRQLQLEGMQSLILDLRDNPGGLLIEAVKVAGMMLPGGAPVATTRGRMENTAVSYKSEGEGDFQEGTLAVIVNGQTASAAEILAGAIQDHDRGVIIGTPTFGKGLVQQIMEFSESSALKLTTAKYYLPSGRCLQKSDWTSAPDGVGMAGTGDSLFVTRSGRQVFGGGGIMPDIYVEESDISDYSDYLRRESCFFDFSVEYIKSHRVDSSFLVNDAILEEFKRFLNSRDLQYQNGQRMAYITLHDELRSASRAAGDALRVLDSEIASVERWQFESNVTEIKDILRETILGQALGESVLYQEVWIPEQAEIRQAIDVLSDSQQYGSILSSN
jgi:carboxyl-terminal processing protease